MLINQHSTHVQCIQSSTCHVIIVYDTEMYLVLEGVMNCAIGTKNDETSA